MMETDMTKITIERQTAQRIYNWIGKSHELIESELLHALRAALAAQPAETQQESAIT